MGPRQYLKDRHGNIIGYFCVGANGKIFGFGQQGTQKGSYDPRTNHTTDRLGTYIGQGNLLAVLILDR